MIPGAQRTRQAILMACVCLAANATMALAADAVASKATNDTQLPRVLSVNLCADQLVMLLADNQQIAALSSLSRDPAGSYFHEKAANFEQADNRAEDILPRAPDVVLTGPYTSRYTLSLLDELDLRVVSLAIADSFAAMLDNIEKVGQAIGQQERAAGIIQALKLNLADISLRVKNLDELAGIDAQNAPRAAVYDANGYTVGHRTLRGEALAIAGWNNVAGEKGIEDYGVLQLEDLINLAPHALVESPYSRDTYSRGQALTSHPALRQSGLNPLLISLPSNQTICAGPWVLEVIEQLLLARQQL